MLKRLLNIINPSKYVSICIIDGEEFKIIQMDYLTSAGDIWDIQAMIEETQEPLLITMTLASVEGLQLRKIYHVEIEKLTGEFEVLHVDAETRRVAIRSVGPYIFPAILVD